MTPWQWWWLEVDGDNYGGWRGECDTREEAIAHALNELPAGTSFWVVQARSSTSMKYEGADCVPFLRTRAKQALES